MEIIEAIAEGVVYLAEQVGSGVVALIDLLASIPSVFKTDK